MQPRIGKEVLQFCWHGSVALAMISLWTRQQGWDQSDAFSGSLTQGCSILMIHAT